MAQKFTFLVILCDAIACDLALLAFFERYYSFPCSNFFRVGIFIVIVSCNRMSRQALCDNDLLTIDLLESLYITLVYFPFLKALFSEAEGLAIDGVTRS